MERILNDDEKIRRAEEIYYRRNNQTYPQEKIKVKSKYVKEKILLNILLIFDIAVIIFGFQNKDYIFTEEFLSYLNQYNVTISEKTVEFFSNIWNDTDNNEEIEIVENNNENESVNETQNDEENNNTTTIENLSSSISQMENDVENLKAAYSFIKPINATMSSPFGSRSSEYQNVTGYHTGVDLAAQKGTTIKASMQGIVTLVSSEGDYGNHIKIRCNNVTTLYAHCSKIFVKEGDIVGQGQEIASVGSTGNSTGPHLHFEIRVDDRFIDPEKIVEF